MGRTLKTKARLDLLHAGPEREINVFVHGYMAVASPAALHGLCQNILSARPRGRSYLLYWKSGRWAVPMTNTTSLGPMLDLAVAHVAVAKVAIPGLVHFRGKTLLANELGQSLKRRLGALANGHDWPINLVGHSLGARVIHEALSCNDWSDFKLRDVILMAGCTPARPGAGFSTWDECAAELHGHLYNVYSPADRILRLAPLAERPIGRHRIIASTPKVTNTEMQGFGHKDYWPNLREVLKASWPRYSPSRCPSLAARIEHVVDCPFCLAPWELTDGEWTCSYTAGGCGLNFHVRGGTAVADQNDVSCGACDYVWQFKAIDHGYEYFCPDCDSVLWDQYTAYR